MTHIIGKVYDINAENMNKLIKELEASQAELKEWVWCAFTSSAHYDSETGLWDSMALSHTRDAGDKLVELGVLERLPDGFGRRWFYREKK